MDSHIINDDPLTGIMELFHQDDAAGQIHLETTQDVTAILERNQAMYNLADGPIQWGDGKCVATIPLAKWVELEKAGITKDPVASAKWLNDPDNRKFRVLPGRI